MGAPKKVTDRYIKLRIDGESDVEVDEDLWDAVCCFRNLQTQWVHAGMAGVVVGLDYNSLRLVVDGYGYDLTDILPKVQFMESVALKHYASTRRN